MPIVNLPRPRRLGGPDKPVPRWLKAKEVAARAKVHRKTVWRWIWRGRLPAYRLPGGWRVDEADLVEFLWKRRTGGTDG